MRGKKVLLLLLSCVLFALIGCSQADVDNVDSNGKGTTVDEKDTIKIGGVYPLTGYLSWLGDYYEKGGKTQIALINEAGGINGHLLDLIIYDDQSSPEEGARITRRLIERDGVIGITGTASVPITGSVYSIAHEKGIPAILQSGYTIDHEKEPFLFNTAYNTQFVVDRPFQYFKKQGITDIGLVMPAGSLGEIGSKCARNAAEQFGLNIIGEETFEVDAPDITTQLANIRGKNPQAIFAFATGEPAAMVARNMDQLGMNIPLLVSHGNANPGFLQLVSGLSLQILVPSGKIMIVEELPNDDPLKETLVAFNKKHIELFGEPANYFSGNLADGVALLAEGLRIAGEPNPGKIRDAIEGISGFKGICGIFNMSPSDHYGTSVNDIVILTIENNDWVLLNE